MSNAYLLNVEFEAPGEDAWSALGGGETVEEALAAAQTFLPDGRAWKPVGWNEWWGC